METVLEQSRDIPIIHQADVCVVGGSCTGVFAAVRAARLGAAVAVVENNGFFGGVATAGLVNIWHSLRDDNGNQQIIGGLTAEIIDRLNRRDALARIESKPEYYVLNTEELKIELDDLVRQAKVRPFLHTRFVAPVIRERKLDAIIVEDKTGRRAIRARYFIDATGDGDVIRRMGLSLAKLDDLQPPTTCAVLEGLAKVSDANPGFDMSQEMFNPLYPEALTDGSLWSVPVTGSGDLTMVAGTCVSNADCSDADQLTQAELEGRRQVRVMLDILRKHFKRGRDVFLRALPAYIGVRETWRARCLHTLTETELLRGEHFEDAIAQGTYPVDIHHSHQPGLTFRYLDGRENLVVPGKPTVQGRWRAAGEPGAAFYQVPYRSLVPRNSPNILVAGRLVDADRGAFGAIRVMVNCNQTGEAAGVACVLAAGAGLEMKDVPAKRLRETLRQGGSIIP